LGCCVGAGVAGGLSGGVDGVVGGVVGVVDAELLGVGVVGVLFCLLVDEDFLSLSSSSSDEDDDEPRFERLPEPYEVPSSGVGAEQAMLVMAAVMTSSSRQQIVLFGSSRTGSNELHLSGQALRRSHPTGLRDDLLDPNG